MKDGARYGGAVSPWNVFVSGLVNGRLPTRGARRAASSFDDSTPRGLFRTAPPPAAWRLRCRPVCEVVSRDGHEAQGAPLHEWVVVLSLIHI